MSVACRWIGVFLLVLPYAAETAVWIRLALYIDEGANGFDILIWRIAALAAFVGAAHITVAVPARLFAAPVSLRIACLGAVHSFLIWVILTQAWRNAFELAWLQQARSGVVSFLREASPSAEVKMRSGMCVVRIDDEAFDAPKLYRLGDLAEACGVEHLRLHLFRSRLDYKAIAGFGGKISRVTISMYGRSFTSEGVTELASANRPRFTSYRFINTLVDCESIAVVDAGKKTVAQRISEENAAADDIDFETSFYRGCGD